MNKYNRYGEGCLSWQRAWNSVLDVYKLRPGSCVAVKPKFAALGSPSNITWERGVRWIRRTWWAWSPMRIRKAPHHCHSQSVAVWGLNRTEQPCSPDSLNLVLARSGPGRYLIATPLSPAQNTWVGCSSPKHGAALCQHNPCTRPRAPAPLSCMWIVSSVASSGPSVLWESLCTA